MIKKLPPALFNSAVTDELIDERVCQILGAAGSDGMRNVDVWAALGLTKVLDPKQWISFRSLERLQKCGRVEKRAVEIEGKKRAEQRYYLT